MTNLVDGQSVDMFVSTHMPLARHDIVSRFHSRVFPVSTHMPLARHDACTVSEPKNLKVSTHMPLARHDRLGDDLTFDDAGFYSHASCEA